MYTLEERLLAVKTYYEMGRNEEANRRAQRVSGGNSPPGLPVCYKKDQKKTETDIAFHSHARYNPW